MVRAVECKRSFVIEDVSRQEPAIRLWCAIFGNRAGKDRYSVPKPIFIKIWRAYRNDKKSYFHILWRARVGNDFDSVA